MRPPFFSDCVSISFSRLLCQQQAPEPSSLSINPHYIFFPPFNGIDEGFQGKIPLTSGILSAYASMMPCLPISYLTLLPAEKESALCRENTGKPEVQNGHSHLPFQPVDILLISILTNLPYLVVLDSPELENPIMVFPVLEKPLSVAPRRFGNRSRRFVLWHLEPLHEPDTRAASIHSGRYGYCRYRHC